MKKILVTGAGGTPSVNFIRSLRESPERFFIVGTDADKYYLMRAEADKRYLVPYATDPNFLPIINKIISEEKVEFVHSQNDTEIKVLSEIREKLKAKTFLPSKKTVRLCQEKYFSYKKWKKAGLRVPQTMVIKIPKDLRTAFKKFGGKLWLRATTGAGGKGSLRAEDFEVAKAWIDFNEGWGAFSAAEALEKDSVTWMSIWHEGKLIVAQGRKRLYWELAKISPSGISGVTGGGITVSDTTLDKIAIRAILAIDKKPHGLFGVDLTYDSKGIPNPTEINIGRFFTTHHFFTEAGINMPYIFTKLAYGEKLPKIRKKFNPVRPMMVWIRGVDFKPVLTTEMEIEKYVKALRKMKKGIKK